MLIENPVADEEDDEKIRPGAIPRGMNRIIDEMYADINNPEIATEKYFANLTILTNAIVHRINDAVAERLSGQAHEYMSLDAVQDDEDGKCYEQEVLHSMDIRGIPPHRLKLKRWIPIVMMRNLNPDVGLCNGTRLRIVDLKPHVIHATIMTGTRQGNTSRFPASCLSVTKTFGISLSTEAQFPIQPTFVMTINKAQGNI
ncbi:hypothetical protein PC120_g23927 [Phytophthora cactorum]|nr:hypothetical protein PC120_g23927 [Phytophthora cactorum]